jgi:stage III sporulation protein AB
MLKILGACLLVFSSSLFGYLIAKNLAARPEQLRRLRTSLVMLETEINYSSTPLPTALDKIASNLKSPINVLMRETSRRLRSGQGLTAEEAWADALVLFRKKSALNSQDLSILRDFGVGLGQSDKKEQLKKLRLIREQLYLQESQAEIEREKNQRMWQTMGILIGLALVVLLY